MWMYTDPYRLYLDSARLGQIQALYWSIYIKYWPFKCRIAPTNNLLALVSRNILSRFL